MDETKIVCRTIIIIAAIIGCTVNGACYISNVSPLKYGMCIDRPMSDGRFYLKPCAAENINGK